MIEEVGVALEQCFLYPFGAPGKEKDDVKKSMCTCRAVVINNNM